MNILKIQMFFFHTLVTVTPVWGDTAKISRETVCCLALNGLSTAGKISSNGEDGAVLITASQLDHIDLKGDVAKIGPGNTWSDFYRKTDVVGKVVTGGRSGTIGVGGLVLGGKNLPKVLAQVDKYHGEDRGPKSSIIVNLINGDDIGYGQFIELDLYYGEGVSSSPDVFKSFFEVPGVLASTVSRKEFSDLVPNGHEGLPPAVNKKASEIFEEEASLFRAKRGANLQPGIFTLSFEPYSFGLISASRETGGNALGLDQQKDPLTLALLTWSWINQTESGIRIAAVKKSVERMKQASLLEGKYVEWVYINEAAADQQPFKSYWKTNFERLRRIRNKYDPEGVFTKLESGGFVL
ncbi:hypothetical protein TWF694_009697 [Orbilia ellipsospora]|uniref:Berberine/berberine-like domain-containing protein n=1 Tax=Orbilia ellipsospora TaxID=2528407 RepID=A0AAV9XEA7_9PEZI